ncbi:MAG: AraC family transcriptional regulator [Pyrinomonadaceae bacterium]
MSNPNTMMHYREITPPDDLRHMILSFWEFSISNDALSPIAHEIFPDGCASVFYIRNLRRGMHIVGLSGLYLETVTKPMSAGDAVWGVRISPAALSVITGTDARRMLGANFLGPEDLPHLLAGLVEDLSAVDDFCNGVAIFEERFRTIAKNIGKHDGVIANAVTVIEKKRGEVRVDELAKSLGLSTRQFQRRFKVSSGLTPKQYIRARRIRATAVDLVEERNQNWAERAADLGFADQAHMTHEFVAMTNRSPNSFAQKVGNIEHGDLVK